MRPSSRSLAGLEHSRRFLGLHLIKVSLPFSGSPARVPLSDDSQPARLVGGNLGGRSRRSARTVPTPLGASLGPGPGVRRTTLRVVVSSRTPPVPTLDDTPHRCRRVRRRMVAPARFWDGSRLMMQQMAGQPARRLSDLTRWKKTQGPSSHVLFGSSSRYICREHALSLTNFSLPFLTHTLLSALIHSLAVL